MKHVILLVAFLASVVLHATPPKVYRGIGEDGDYKIEGEDPAVAEARMKKAAEARAKAPHIYVAPAREVPVASDFGAGSSYYLETKSGWQTIARVKIPDVAPGEVWDIVAAMCLRNFGPKIAFFPRVVVSTSPVTLGLVQEKNEHLVIHVGGEYIGENSRRWVKSWQDHWVVPPGVTGNVFVELQAFMLSVPEGVGQGKKVAVRRLGQQFVSIIRHQ